MLKKYDLSPNFSKKVRKKKDIKFVIIHYTGMQSEIESIKRLKNSKSKVSSHYLINRKGKIIQMVMENKVAWHAGKSKWKNTISLNKSSIGIEIHNEGHEHKYKNFTPKQLKSLKKLLRKLIEKYKINLNNILGHSDIAPERKKDPGEKFPWEYLAKKKVGYWHNIDQKYLLKKRKIKTSSKEKIKFIKNLYKIGYSQNFKISQIKFSKIITKAFQRRFRQSLINPTIDQECLSISENLVKKMDKFS